MKLYKGAFVNTQLHVSVDPRFVQRTSVSARHPTIHRQAGTRYSCTWTGNSMRARSHNWRGHDTSRLWHATCPTRLHHTNWRRRCWLYRSACSTGLDRLSVDWNGLHSHWNFRYRFPKSTFDRFSRLRGHVLKNQKLRLLARRHSQQQKKNAAHHSSYCQPCYECCVHPTPTSRSRSPDNCPSATPGCSAGSEGQYSIQIPRGWLSYRDYIWERTWDRCLLLACSCQSSEITSCTTNRKARFRRR